MRCVCVCVPRHVLTCKAVCISILCVCECVLEGKPSLNLIDSYKDKVHGNHLDQTFPNFLARDPLKLSNVYMWFLITACIHAPHCEWECFVVSSISQEKKYEKMNVILRSFLLFFTMHSNLLRPLKFILAFWKVSVGNHWFRRWLNDGFWNKLRGNISIS